MYHRFKWTGASHRRNGMSREYEPLQPYFLLALIKATGAKTFVDVGANIGAYSVLMSPAVDSIIAFEANPMAADEMQKNLDLNGIAATLHRKVATDKVGSVTFGKVSRLAGNSAVVETAGHDGFRETTETEAVTLDSVLEGCAEPLALKVDVEGHEHQVLAGATETLIRPCVIQIENHSGDLEIPGLTRITDIGPDRYFSNLPVDATAIYEAAAKLMIAANHEHKSAVFQLGAVEMAVSGTPYRMLRAAAMKLMGSRL